MEKKNRLFRKSRFGGFNKDDVIDYIEKMKNDFFEYKSDVEKTLSDLRKRISELEDENAKLLSDCADNQKAEKELNETYPIDEINEAADRLKMVADEICDSLIEFLGKLNDNSFTVSIETPSQIDPSQFSSPDELILKNDDLKKSPEKNETVVSDVLDSFFSNEKSVDEQKGKKNELILESVFPSYLFK